MLQYSFYLSVLFIAGILFSLSKLQSLGSIKDDMTAEDLLSAPMLVLKFTAPLVEDSENGITLSGVTDFTMSDQDGVVLNQGRAGVELKLESLPLTCFDKISVVLHNGHLSSYSYQLPSGGFVTEEIIK